MKISTEITLMTEEVDDIIRKYFEDTYNIDQISYEIGYKQDTSNDPRDSGFGGIPILKQVKVFIKG